MFGVQLVSQENVRPSSPTPRHRRTYKLSLIDQFYPSSHATVVLFYGPNCDEPITERLRVLKTSLSRTLANYYPLAGRLEGSSQVDCSDQGVDFLTSRVADVELTQLLREPDVSFLGHLLPCGDSCVEEPGRGALLSLQVTTFACDGMSIGVCISHRIADGTSLIEFLNAWAAEARGTAALRRPYFGAASLFWPVEPAPILLVPGSTKGMVLRRFVLDEAAVDILRTGKKNGPRPTRFEAVTALLWRCITRARTRAGSEGKAMVSVSIDLRRRMAPPMPELAFGNIITVEVVSVVGGGSDDDEERCLVEQLRSAVGRVDGEYVRRIEGPEGFSWAAEVAGELAALSVTTDRYNFSSWCRFPIYETDFGWGKPIWAGVGKSSSRSDVILMDKKSDGGVEAWVTMDEVEMTELDGDEELCSFASQRPVIYLQA